MESTPVLFTHEGETISEGPKPDYVMVDGSALKRLRKEQGYSQCSLALAVGMSQVCLSNLEEGKVRSCAIETAEKLTVALDPTRSKAG